MTGDCDFHNGDWQHIIAFRQTPFPFCHFDERQRGEILNIAAQISLSCRNDKRLRHVMKDYNFYVYILTNWNNKVMYIGMTNNLERRLYEHKNKLVDGFTKKYNVTKLVYYEHTTDVHVAIAREKEIKKWRREKKNKLVISMNPNWQDLSLDWERISPSGRNDKPNDIAISAGDNKKKS